jgi:PadR family transcriptional regulator
MPLRLDACTPKKPRTRNPARFDEVLKAPIKSKTLFPVLILHLLKRKPDHGYGLMTRIEKLCGGLIAVNTNKIYPLLRRLEERGFLTAKWDHPSKRSRRIYVVTAEGEARLNRIKGAMLPYLDAMSTAVKDLKKELYR